MPGQQALLLVDAVDAFGPGEGLPAVVGDEDILLHDAGHIEDAVVVIEPVEYGPFGNESLAGRGRNENVGIDIRHGLLDDLVESVVNGENNDKRRRSDRHSGNADSRNDVDHIV